MLVSVGKHLAAGVVTHLEELPGLLSKVAAGFHNLVLWTKDTGMID